MKKILLLLTVLLNTSLLFAQTTDYFNYQSAIRNSEGELETNQDINFKFLIRQGSAEGTIVYSETQLAKSNSFGVCNLKIGEGTDASGSLSEIAWGADLYFLSVAMDITGATSFTEINTIQLVTVPFAMYAKNAGELDKDVLHFPESDTLFAVRDHDGKIVFAVFPDGARVYVNEGVKGRIGGFAVTGRNPDKAGAEEDYMVVTPDSTRVWVNEQAKGRIGGFAVTGRNPGKGMSGDYFVINSDSARIYINDTTTSKGRIGGFAVTGRNPDKGANDDYLRVTRDSTRVYVTEDGTKGRIGGFAVTGRNPDKGNATNDYFNVSGNESAEVIYNESRVMWYPKKAALLAGEVHVGASDSVGTNSTALGYRSIAMGEQSQAFGYQSQALGNYSTAIGKNALADTINSFAFGNGTKALNENSFAIGQLSEATGIGSFALGYAGLDSAGVQIDDNTQASGDYSYAFGSGAVASGKSAYALGTKVTASGDNSYALGYNSSVSGAFSMVFGKNSSASGDNSYAFGDNCHASNHGFALGINNTASGTYSTCIGKNSNATGWISLAAGGATTASGSYSTAFGYTATASADYAFAAGKGAVASNTAAIAIGWEAKAEGHHSFAIGRSVKTTASYCSAFGFGMTVSGSGSIGFNLDYEAGYNLSQTKSMAIMGGNVGIGTLSPSSRLEVAGNAEIYGKLRLYNSSVFDVWIQGGDFSSTGADRNIALLGYSDVLYLNYQGAYTGGTVIGGKTAIWGDVGIGIGSPSTKLHVNGTADLTVNSSSGIVLIGDAIGNNIGIDGNEIMARNNGSTSTLYLQNNGGDVYVGGSLAHSSDLRLKKNISSLNYGLKEIMKLKAVTYDWKNNSNKKKQIGFIAQDMEQVIDELVLESDDEMRTKTINYIGLTPVLVNAIQEQQVEIEQLKSDKENLEQRVQKLEEALNILLENK